MGSGIGDFWEPTVKSRPENIGLVTYNATCYYLAFLFEVNYLSIMKDWTGNKNSVFVCNGASNHTDEERQQHDYYATEPKAIELLLDLERFSPSVWECACGEGHISKVLENRGYRVMSTDLIDRGYGIGGVDFLETTKQFDGDIITNPPYKLAREFVEHALAVVTDGHKVAMFLKVTFLESKARRKLFENHNPKVIYVSSSRLQCAKNGDFEKYGKGSATAVAYAWFVWEKGYHGDTIVRWFN